MKPVALHLPFKFTFYFRLCRTQTVEGITSRVLDEPEEKHLNYVLFDFDDCTLEQAIQKLSEVQKQFGLGHIYVFSDKEGCYRAYCWSKRPFIEYIHILCHTFPLLDFGFFIWTVRRTSATLRSSKKQNRPHQKLVAVLKGYEHTESPQGKLTRVVYETGLEKPEVVNIG